MLDEWESSKAPCPVLAVFFCREGGAVLILIPRWTFYGAIIITCTVGLGTYLCFTMPLYNPIFPMAMTLLAATLAGLAWPRKPA